MCHWLERDGELLAQRARNARRLGRPYAAYDAAKLAWIAAQRGPRLQPRLEIPGRAKLIDLLDRYGILSKDRRQPGDQEFPLTE
jgi:1,2-diacylglycerol 3-beta-galactosyltransferase